MWALLSGSSKAQWLHWDAVRAIATHVISAEVAQHVAQHGHGLVKVPDDMVETLDDYFKGAGLTGKAAKLSSRALTDKLKALSRSPAKGGLQPYRDPATGTAQLPHTGDSNHQGMTAEQLQEQEEMEAELEQMAAAFGPATLQQHRQDRAAAKAAAALPLARTKSGRLKASAKAALLDHIAQHGMLSVPHEHLRIALDLPPSATLNSPQRAAELKQATPAYTESQALGYAVSRLPGCYAAASRVFKELQLRAVGFQPRSMLDFGAGPGTAIWAAQEVWPDSLRHVTAVEPSDAMRRMGVRLEAARRFAHESSPLVRWQAELPQQRPPGRQAQHKHRYDLVVAGYVLGEVASPAERAALVRHLWSLTTDVLVLLEPGTPAGSANVQEARAAVLQREQRKVSKLFSRLSTGSSSSSSSSSSSDTDVGELSEQQLDHNLQQKTTSKAFGGAHVVAPCPHDGACPLAMPGTKAWCHFGTRFQRPAFMQAAKAARGARANPADHQDERYSYVVLRRGQRAAPAPAVDISRSFQLKSHAVRHGLSKLGGQAIGSRAADIAVLQDQVDKASADGGVEEGVSDGSMLSNSSAARRNSMSSRPAPLTVVLSGHRSVLQQHGQHMNRSAADPELQCESPAHAEIAEIGPADTPLTSSATLSPSGAVETHRHAEAGLLTAEELQQLSALLGVPAGQQGAASPPASVTASDNGIFSSSLEEFNSERKSYDKGVVSRLIALEDAGIDWTANGTKDLAAELTDTRSSVMAAGPNIATCSQSVHDPIATYRESESSDHLHQQEQQLTTAVTRTVDSGPQQQAVGGAAELATAVASSASWSRIIRPPRRRGGHVILDVCALAEPCVNSANAITSVPPFTHGQLERHVVARSDMSDWMGQAGYKLATSANWGDLWPTVYNKNQKRVVLKKGESSAV